MGHQYIIAKDNGGRTYFCGVTYDGTPTFTTDISKACAYKSRFHAEQMLRFQRIKNGSALKLNN